MPLTRIQSQRRFILHDLSKKLYSLNRTTTTLIEHKVGVGTLLIGQTRLAWSRNRIRLFIHILNHFLQTINAAISGLRRFRRTLEEAIDELEATGIQ